MKKILALFMCLVTLPLAAACDRGIQRQTDGNRTSFILENFEGKYEISLDRSVQGEGTIYFSASLSEGEANVYYDLGLLWEKELLFCVKANEPIDGNDGYVEYDDVRIVIEAVSPATGEIVMDFEKETQTD